MSGDVPDLDSAEDGVTAPPAPQEESQPVRLLTLGDPTAAVCEGDVCYLPGPGSV